MKTALGLVFLLLGTAFAAPMDHDDPELQELMRELQELKEARRADEDPEPVQMPAGGDESEGFNEEVERGQDNFGQEDLYERQEGESAGLLERGGDDVAEAVMPGDDGFNSGPAEDKEERGWYESLEDEAMDERGAEEAAGMTEDEADEIAKQILDSATGADNGLVARGVSLRQSKRCRAAIAASSTIRGELCPKDREEQKKSATCRAATRTATEMVRKACPRRKKPTKSVASN